MSHPNAGPHYPYFFFLSFTASSKNSTSTDIKGDKETTTQHIHSFNRYLLGSYYTVGTVPGARNRIMNKIILYFEVLRLVKETDIVKYNEEGTKIGRCTGYRGNQHNSSRGGHQKQTSCKDVVIPELRFKE